MGTGFLDAARQGENQWWRYLYSILLIVFAFAGLGLVLAGVGMFFFVLLFPAAVGADGAASLPEQLQQLANSRSVPVLAISLIPFVCAFFSLVLVTQVIHKRDFRTLISGDRTIRWRQIALGFGVWSLLLSLLCLVGYFLSPASYELTFTPSQWFVLLPVALVLIPIQTSAEELLFRGYILQGTALLTRQPLLLILFNSLLFMLPHLGNPEMQRGFVWGALTYWLLGVFLTAITVRSDRLELALGVHAAQNLFIALILNTEDSALPTPSLWTVTDTIDPRSSFFGLLLLSALFYAIFFWRRRTVR